MNGREFDAAVSRFWHQLRVRLSRALARWSQVVEPPPCEDPGCCFRPGIRSLTLEPCPPLCPDPALVYQVEGDERTIRRYREAAEAALRCAEIPKPGAPDPFSHWPEGDFEGWYLSATGEHWRHVPNVGWERG